MRWFRKKAICLWPDCNERGIVKTYWHGDPARKVNLCHPHIVRLCQTLDFWLDIDPDTVAPPTTVEVAGVDWDEYS